MCELMVIIKKKIYLGMGVQGSLIGLGMKQQQ